MGYGRDARGWRKLPRFAFRRSVDYVSGACLAVRNDVLQVRLNGQGGTPAVEEEEGMGAVGEREKGAQHCLMGYPTPPAFFALFRSFQAAGGIDEKAYTAYYEDTDLQVRYWSSWGGESACVVTGSYSPPPTRCASGMSSACPSSTTRCSSRRTRSRCHMARCVSEMVSHSALPVAAPLAAVQGGSKTLMDESRPVFMGRWATHLLEGHVPPPQV